MHVYLRRKNTSLWSLWRLCGEKGEEWENGTILERVMIEIIVKYQPS